MAQAAGPLDQVRLLPLMKRGTGTIQVRVGLIDGPVQLSHPELDTARFQTLGKASSLACSRHSSFACTHGTFVAGILASTRGSAAPAICPGCTILLRPIFEESAAAVPVATAGNLAAAIVDCVNAGAHVVNLSAALLSASGAEQAVVRNALDHASARGTIIVAAAGNDSTIGSTAITRHPWVIPVVAYDLEGRPLALSNLGASIGRSGLGAPGQRITSLSAAGPPRTFDGTSVATPFVAGAIALLRSEFPQVAATAIREAVDAVRAGRRASLMPPLLDAWGAYQRLAALRRT
jgi:subtilisin family serine protease